MTFLGGMFPRPPVRGRFCYVTDLSRDFLSGLLTALVLLVLMPGIGWNNASGPLRLQQHSGPAPAAILQMCGTRTVR
jgi:hypothetical protein